MAERQLPPSSCSTPTAGLSRMEDLETKSGSDADADADQANKPKPAAQRRGWLLIDDDPSWGKPVHEIEEPAAWGRGFPMIDDNTPWDKPVQESSGHGVDYGSGRVMVVSPVERGGGSTLDQLGGANRKQGNAPGSGFAPSRQKQRQRRQDTASSRGIGEEEKDLWLPKKRARHISIKPQDKMIMFSPQDPSMALKGAKTVFRDKEGMQIREEDMCKAKEPDKSKLNDQEFVLEGTQNTPHSWLKHGVDPPNRYGIKSDHHWDGVDRSYDAYMKSIAGSRSEREGKVWHCDCKATNFPKCKLVFSLPKFQCDCGRKFLEKNNLDFCLADIRANYELVVSRIFDQDGPYCIENACCQAMLINHTMDCIIKDTKVNEHMINVDPGKIITAYLEKYPWVGQGIMSSIPQSSVHKFIKLALMLKNSGIELQDKTFWRIGDISFIDKDDHETICEELANGVPLLAIFTPGVNFQHLQYCEVYRPPLLKDFHECNNFHKEHNHRTMHEAHMVVLIGPAFKANGKNPGHAYYFLNSHARWCQRKVIDNTHELAGDIQKPVEYGIGKVEAKGLVYSVIKLWKFGETAGPDSIKLEDEDEDDATKYENKVSNKQKFTGEYQASQSQ